MNLILHLMSHYQFVLPANVVMMPVNRDSLRTRLLPYSLMYRLLLVLSTASPRGLRSLADVPGPPSPIEPDVEPVPAMTEMLYPDAWLVLAARMSDRATREIIFLMIYL